MQIAIPMPEQWLRNHHQADHDIGSSEAICLVLWLVWPG
jgi:hypothetical protein